MNRYPLGIFYFLSNPGKKLIMGITGFIWTGFVFLHMAGNMLIFGGSDVYNSYAHKLTSSGIIYLVEAILILALIIHIITAISLTITNKRARSHDYLVTPNQEKGISLSSKTMIAQGSIILVFIITHLIGFKFGTYYETTVNGVPMRDLYRLVFEVFQQPLAVLWYLVALILLGFHLSHGFGSVFQSLGLRTRSNEKILDQLSVIYAVVVTSGFMIQPIYVFFMR